MTPDNAPSRVFADALAREQARVEARCSELIDTLAAHHDRLTEAMKYCVLGGGKRLRPVLCLWTYDLFGPRTEDYDAHDAVLNAHNAGLNAHDAVLDAHNAVLDAACALEFIHSYSLVHDDLPCMDDDDTRRGQPSSHVKFGEATAVLTGDALVTLAFDTVAHLVARWNVSPQVVVEALEVLTVAAGTGGLVGGQALDLESEGCGGDRALVERIHRGKTAALIAAAMETGAVMAGADLQVRTAVREAGYLSGSAFQITDDLLDGVGSKETLGKTPGKDIKTGKITYMSVASADEARREADSRIAAAKRLLPNQHHHTAAHGRMVALLGLLVDRKA